MPKTQTDLSSFFGGTPAQKKDSQKKLDSFFGKGKKKDTVGGKAEEKENNANKRVSPENDTKKGATAAKKSKVSVDSKRLKRVIDDDSSDDEEMKHEISAAEAEEKQSNQKTTQDKKEKSTTSAMDVKSKDVPHEQKESGPPNKDECVEGMKGKEQAEEWPEKECADVSGIQEETPGTSNKTAPAKAAKVVQKSSPKSSMQSSFFERREKKTSTETEENPSVENMEMDKELGALHPKEEAPVPAADLTYGDVCEAFEKIEAITGRLEIQQIMTNLFRSQITSGNPENLYPMMYLCSNSVAPAYECVELGVGDSILIKAIAEAYGTNISAVKERYDEVGDLGHVAQSFKGKQKTLGGFFTAKAKAKPLSCKEVLTTFREIADMKGNQSQKWKTEKIKKMLVRATHVAEPKYIVRGLQGKLRIGLAQSTVLISLAHALHINVPPKVADKMAENSKKKICTDDYPEEAKIYMDKKQPKGRRLEAAVAIVKKAYSEGSSYDALLDAALNVPLQELHKACTLSPGIPVAPMLAKPTKSVREVLNRLNGLRFTCEYKYDGERAQVHMLTDGTTKVFSRNLLNTSEKYPEVPVFVKEAANDNVTSCVLDTEVVAYDVKKEKLVPFQVLSTRKKTEESAETAKVQVIVQAFDLMYLNGKSLLNATLQERRNLLHSHFSAVTGKFTFAVSRDHIENGDTTVIEEFLDQAVKNQCEGLMVKTLDANAIYEPSRRSLNWLKLKKDYLEGLGDSVDLVPLGAYHGRGKRTGVYGAYLLACYDPDAEEFQSVCKIGTGFSDENLKSLAANLNKHIRSEKSRQYNVSDQLECDVWFDPVEVWEVKAADLSKSSAHRGAAGKTGEEGRGIGLRFPRFERLREDKKTEEATTSDQILEMYYNQDSVGGKGGDGDTGDPDDDGI